MCATCGCGPEGHGKLTVVGEDLNSDKLQAHANGHEHHHDDHGHGHSHTGGKSMVLMEREILHENDLLAERNRGFFMAKNILAINLVSSPGSGKTTLLENTLTALKGKIEFYVVEGDQQTTRDADRIHATGTKVTQINTGKGCHLDAHMVLHALEGMKNFNDGILFIENVGNLVCPAMFDLGESQRVVVISVTEGDDKPLKYPEMFHTSSLCIINKTDLLPYVNFDVEKAREYALRVNPQLQFIEVSCSGGQGLDSWYKWLESKLIASPEIASH